MDSQTSLSQRSIFLVERESSRAIRLSEALAARGLQTRAMARLVDVMKASRTQMPRAVIIDLACAGNATEPHERMGPDHIMRVLRQTYPELCIVALASSADARMEAIAREFRVPLITKSFGSAELLSILEECGAIGPVETASASEAMHA
ncbi:hypothetical protein ACFPN2_34170 [Steroidobacter flavus]|uniref:Response regulatory domain-containing protein n=1 Tax=Steroidobacter flavus TaxID=1842136 RepID=A0ABV8T498_9GAMM